MGTTGRQKTIKIQLDRPTGEVALEFLYCLYRDAGRIYGAAKHGPTSRTLWRVAILVAALAGGIGADEQFHLAQLALHLR